MKNFLKSLIVAVSFSVVGSLSAMQGYNAANLEVTDTNQFNASLAAMTQAADQDPNDLMELFEAVDGVLNNALGKGATGAGTVFAALIAAKTTLPEDIQGLIDDAQRKVQLVRSVALVVAKREELTQARTEQVAATQRLDTATAKTDSFVQQLKVVRQQVAEFSTNGVATLVVRGDAALQQQQADIARLAAATKQATVKGAMAERQLKSAREALEDARLQAENAASGF